MLVSIIIPCYNVVPYVARALDSALAQTYTDTEIICVDNNSTDETLAILEDYQKRFPAKIQVYKESIQGAPAARNLGLKHAKGEWLQFLDADDEIFPEKISSQLELVKNNPDASVIIGARCVISAEGIVQNFYNTISCPIVAVFLSEAGNTLANFWKSRDLNDVGGWNESYLACQEYELLSRLVIAKKKVVLDNRILSTAYQRRNSISYCVSNYYEYNFKLRKYLYSEVLIDSAYDCYRTQIDKRFFNIIKMYGKVNSTAALEAFERYFHKRYKTGSFFGEGVFYSITTLLGYKIGLKLLTLHYLITKNS